MTSTSIVDPTAVLGQGTTVGEGCVIGPNVRIGAGCRIGHLVVIHPDTAVGNEVRIDDHATLGKLPMRAANSATTASSAPAWCCTGAPRSTPRC